MTNNMTQIDSVAKAIEKVLIGGDLSSLSPEQKVGYYNKVCDSLGLNPLTQPFSYIRLNGKEVLYALRACTEQLRSIHNVSIQIVSREMINDVYVVTARASTPGGRFDESTGAVAMAGLKGDNLANAYLRAETKAKRRVTLSICGLGLLDETEVDSIPEAKKVVHEVPRLTVNGKEPATLPEFIQAKVEEPSVINNHEIQERVKNTEVKFFEEPPISAYEDLGIKNYEDEERAAFADEDYTIPFGKLKGKLLTSIDVPTLSKSVWAANKGIQDQSEWVAKVGEDKVLDFIQRAEAYLRTKE
jgi:hypothetical protein